MANDPGSPFNYKFKRYKNAEHTFLFLKFAIFVIFLYSKTNIMQYKLSKSTLQFIFGLTIMLFIAVGCSDSSSSSEIKTDSTAVDSSKMDTNKMDTANTKPIVIPPDGSNK